MQFLGLIQICRIRTPLERPRTLDTEYTHQSWDTDLAIGPESYLCQEGPRQE